MVFQDFRIPEAGVARLAGEQVFDVFVFRILHHAEFTGVQQQILDDRAFRVLWVIRHGDRLLSWCSRLT